MSPRRLPKVLTYHTVLPERPRQGLFFYAQPTAAEFEEQMRALARRRRALTLEQYLQVASGRRSAPRGAVLVTFDDGFADSELAASILRRHGVPSVLFLAVDYIGTHRWPWYVALDWLLESAPVREVEWRGESFPLARLAQRKIFRERFKTLYLQAPPGQREPLLVQLQAALGAELPPAIPSPYRFLDWDGVRRIAADPLVEIGSHGLSHHDLTRLDDEGLRLEMEQSRRIIRERTGVAPRAFSYPDGRHDARVREAARRVYDVAFALRDASASDPAQLPRLPAVAGGAGAMRRVLSPLYGPRERLWRWRAQRGWIT